MTLLHQLIAAEKDIKASEERKLTAAYHEAQKPALFNGFDKTYAPAAEDGQQLPPERLLIQAKVSSLLDRVAASQGRIMDLAATKDTANQQAKADLVLGNGVVIFDVPVTTLLWLEKKLVDVRTFAASLPTLVTDEQWTWDGGNGHWATAPQLSLRQVKRPEFITVAPATDKHQATIVEKQKDVVEGTWHLVKRSAAIPATQKATIVGRIDALIVAVKQAREKANTIEAPDVRIGSAIMDYLFG